VLGAKILVCDPADPEAKGLVERANGYLETSFLPSRMFTSPADFNAQLRDWLVVVNQRPWWAAVWRWPPTWTGSARSATGGWSPTMRAAGPATSGRPSASPMGAKASRKIQLRCLADYDAAFGLDDGTQGVARCRRPRPPPGT
jgi:hypothetical protein